MNELEQDDNAKKRKMDEAEINLKVSDKKNEEEEETMNQQDSVEYEKKLILNTKDYLIAEMEERKRKEMKQLHWQNSFKPMHWKSLTADQRKKMLESLIYVERK